MISVLSFDYNNAFMCDCIFECQKEIRNYIIQNQECFDTVDGKKTSTIIQLSRNIFYYGSFIN